MQKVWHRNVAGLKIERIYEHGEFLAYLRFLQRHILRPPACNPQVRSIRFGVLHGSVTKQHNLPALTSALLHWSSVTPAAAKKLDLPEPAPTTAPAHRSALGQSPLQFGARALPHAASRTISILRRNNILAALQKEG